MYEVFWKPGENQEANGSAFRDIAISLDTGLIVTNPVSHDMATNDFYLLISFWF